MKTIISLLSGDIEKVEGIWRSRKWQQLRVAAAASLAQKMEQSTYILFSQGGYASEGRPSLAHVMSEELSELGVPQTSIIEEDRSISTYRQLLELQEYLAKEFADTTIRIISNDWHLGRIAALLECLPELAQLASRKPELVAAEAVLLENDSHRWQSIIDKTRSAENMKALVKKEAQGAMQIREGTYHFR